MFLQPLLDRNFQFISSAVQLHQKGEIDANTYVFDLETVTSNAKLLSEKGQRRRYSHRFHPFGEVVQQNS